MHPRRVYRHDFCFPCRQSHSQRRRLYLRVCRLRRLRDAHRVYADVVPLTLCRTPKAPLPGADSPYQGEMPRRAKRGRDAGAKRLRGRGRQLRKAKTNAHPQALSHLVVGADAHIDPRKFIVSTEISDEFATFLGPTESSAPTTALALPCRGGRLCPPAGYTGFTVFFGEFVTSHSFLPCLFSCKRKDRAAGGIPARKSSLSPQTNAPAAERRRRVVFMDVLSPLACRRSSYAWAGRLRRRRTRAALRAPSARA